MAGADVVKLVKQYPGRIKLLHIKDMAQDMDEPYTTFDPSGDMASLMQIMQNQTIIGNGVIDFRSIISQFADSEIEHLVIESDFPPEPLEYARQSAVNLKKILSSF